ncbi:MAG: hypothetical protein HOE32_10610, partial [Nitrospina sp.]|nr:hypothetical protein [Nitrospina sp.]
MTHLPNLNCIRKTVRKGFIKGYVCVLAAWIALFPALSYALPSDPTVKAGSVAFDRVDANTLNITQSTQKAIVD